MRAISLALLAVLHLSSFAFACRAAREHLRQELVEADAVFYARPVGEAVPIDADDPGTDYQVELEVTEVLRGPSADPLTPGRHITVRWGGLAGPRGRPCGFMVAGTPNATRGTWLIVAHDLPSERWWVRNRGNSQPVGRGELGRELRERVRRMERSTRP